jgi:hypothetical protein
MWGTAGLDFTNSTFNLAYDSYRSQAHLVRLGGFFCQKSRNRTALTEIRGCSNTVRLYA